MTFTYRFIDSPVGQLKLIAKGSALAAILWENDRPNRVLLGAMSEDRGSAILNRAEQQLAEYFAGARSYFDLALEFHGTEFQKQVWQALLTIPFGETRSYLQIAIQIGNPAAVRAVGAANGRNPISIVAPCHRVIGSSGALTGFAGGLTTKQMLLTLEGGVPTLVKRRTQNPLPIQTSLF
ncbi:methylated-DNA--[protein]-cysteine S-methyltransferase [Pseudomonas sp. LP_7_YM]|uniref:methylated-DNA--[protein]-cysteine S-methyltransferase n=1 Tax=Pseudomonas sp. LP_7_YM TaxID=2485137 RepID=UPI00105E4841|nr:methylated-DNA--[protein]-cysteine S-methyltransferase [Pseudomonas sp. LP_7_YM]TDV72809.1 methylated-DNA-[protein]-cysteine S-methyltransferase [Pseudomonas sp. LP_7_YM]